MSFLFYMMDDLRCFFFFFFVVVLAVGLARDGCLVRSWFGVAQRGGAAGLRGSEAVLGWLQKHPIPTAPEGWWVLSLAKLKTRVKS